MQIYNMINQLYNMNKWINSMILNFIVVSYEIDESDSWYLRRINIHHKRLSAIQIA